MSWSVTARTLSFDGKHPRELDLWPNKSVLDEPNQTKPSLKERGKKIYQINLARRWRLSFSSALEIDFLSAGETKVFNFQNTSVSKPWGVWMKFWVQVAGSKTRQHQKM